MTRAHQAWDRPLLSARVRPLAVLLVVAVCVIIVVSMGAWLAHGTQASPLDARVDPWLGAHIGSGRRIVLAAVWLGNPVTVTAICTVLVLACLVTRRYRGALCVAIGVPLAGGITEVAKHLFDRTITGGLAFPSGHLTATSAMAAAVLMLLNGPARPPVPVAVRWLLSALTVLALPWVAVGLVVGHFHYFTDTIGGACVGTGTVLATALLLDWVSLRLRRRPPVAQESAARGGISEPARELPRA